MNKLYLDHASTTPMRKEVLKVMMPYFTEEFANPRSNHKPGHDAMDAVEKAREVIAKTISASPAEIIFTSGGTESNNLAIKGVANANITKGKSIITTVMEHESVYEPCEFLKSKGFNISYLPGDVDGAFSGADVRPVVTPKTTLITAMHANNEVGTIQPIQTISRIGKEKGVPIHTDAVQTYGAIPVSVKTLGVSLMSFTAHKIYGPKGIGALYVKEGIKLEPQMHGKDDEYGLRAGMLNVPAIVGFAEAAKLIHKEMKKEMKRQTKLRNLMLNYINDSMKGVKTNGHRKNRLPNNINISFNGITGPELVQQLDALGIQVSTSSDSRALEMIGVKGEKAVGSLRVSIGKDTTEKDVRYAMKTIQSVVEKARKKY